MSQSLLVESLCGFAAYLAGKMAQDNRPAKDPQLRQAAIDLVS
jgi:hypothetical protein